MPTFSFKKLVRDNIGDWHVEAGHKVKIKDLTNEEYDVALRQKLIEESNEVASAKNRKELIEEIADVMQVLRSLSLKHAIETREIETVRLAKEAKKGGFGRRVFIDSVTMSEADEWTAYCRMQPEKYEEKS